jgi:uroporphyrin-3 C-methyltransferase
MNDNAALTPPAAPRKSRRWLLLLPVIAAGAGGFVLWQRATDTADAKVAALEAEVSQLTQARATAQNALADAQTALSTHREAATSADERFTALEAKLTALATAQAALPKVDGNVFAQLALNDATALIGLAEQRLQLARDIAGASAALNLARARLSTPDSALGVAIARDLAQLGAFHDADLAGMASALGELARASRGWPVAAVPTTPAAPTADAQPAAGETIGWRSVLEAIWHDLRSLVEIRKLGSSTDPLLDPLHASIARERVRLSLEAARLAVLARDMTTRDEALQAAQTAITEGFDPTAPEVQDATRRLASLMGLDLKPDLPSLGAPDAATAARAEAAL